MTRKHMIRKLRPVLQEEDRRRAVQAAVLIRKIKQAPEMIVRGYAYRVRFLVG